MRLKATTSDSKRIGIFPLLLALLLAVRVAASPAIQCQHELAAQASRTAQIATGFPYEVGDLCGLLISGGDSEHDEDVLNSLCPFFMAPGILPVSDVDVAANDQSYSWFRPIPVAIRTDANATLAGYNPRAPPATV